MKLFMHGNKFSKICSQCIFLLVKTILWSIHTANFVRHILHACMCVCVCMCAYVHACMFPHACMHVYVCMCMSVI